MQIEPIVTQLVFEHALRVRMKAETSDAPGSASSASGQEEPTVVQVKKTRKRGPLVKQEEEEEYEGEIVAQGCQRCKDAGRPCIFQRSVSEKVCVRCRKMKVKCDPQGSMAGKCRSLTQKYFTNFCGRPCSVDNNAAACL